MVGYDIIGDVHGNADQLTGLLEAMGYEAPDNSTGNVWRHPERTAVFVGDLVDRGPQQLDTINIARSMVEAGAALITMGNHEFNLVAYSTFDPERADYCRSRLGWRGDKHARQHRHVIDEVGLDSALHADIVAWFRTLPLWLDLDGVRVVHACWHDPSIAHLTPLLAASGGVLTDDIVIAATTEGSPTFDAIEVLLKGPEVHLGGRTYADKSGVRRGDARLRWWDPDAGTLRDAALIPGDATEADGSAFPPLPEIAIDTAGSLRYHSDIPVVFGHYWFTGTPTPTGGSTACVDYSAGNGGPLVAYRWSGETALVAENFVSQPDGP